MGARVALADDQTPMGTSSVQVLTRDESGAEVLRWLPGQPPTVLRVVHFVDLDDGRRVTTEAFGEMSLEMVLDCTEPDLHDEVREFIVEDEMQDIPEVANEPRWHDMVEALSQAGVTADEAALARLPFAIEVEPAVLERLPN
jgi:hypothetical protein